MSSEIQKLKDILSRLELTERDRMDLEKHIKNFDEESIVTEQEIDNLTNKILQ